MNQMTRPGTDLLPAQHSRTVAAKKSPDLPLCIQQLGTAGHFVWNEFFSAQISNRHTRAAYLHAVTKFLKWSDDHGIPLNQLQPGDVGTYLERLEGTLPTKKLHLSAIRKFGDLLVNRHILLLNPATTVRGERYQAIEGKTPEITKSQARTLLASIDTSRPVGLRDRGIIACLIYTAARAGAVASLKLKDFASDGTQYSLRFAEKGGKDRRIPCRHDLEQMLREYLEVIDWTNQPKDSPIFRSAAGRAGQLTDEPIRNIDICRMVKRRLKDAGLPAELSPHSFRVATVTDLLTQGVPLEDVQYLAGHSDPRVTRLYDRRQKIVTRNTVERISI